MKQVLDKSFFERPVLETAPDLLGKYLVRATPEGEIALPITETEAYDGETDLACHAARGRTARTEVMYGDAGVWYVYLIYGMYDLINIVTGPQNYPSAVLLRGLEGISGPGRLTRALHITRAFNAQPATPTTGLWIEDRGLIVPSVNIVQTPRIGVDYAKEWAEKPWRFVINLQKESK